MNKKYFLLFFIGALLSIQCAFAQLQATVSNKKDACNSTFNGSFDVTVEPPGTTGPYTIFVFGLSFGQTDVRVVATHGTLVTFTGLRPDTYLVNTGDSDGSTANDTDFITINNITAALGATTASTTNNSDCSSPNGAINITPSGGSGSYSYSWTGPGTFSATTEDITNLAGGSYSVVISDNGTNCTFSYGPITITDPVPNAFTISTSDANICAGEDFDFVLDDTDNGVTYDVFDGATLLTSTTGTGSAINLMLSGLSTGSHTITVRAKFGSCTPIFNTAPNISVTVGAFPTIFNVTGGGSYCAGGSGVAIGLADSESGVNYTLMRGATTVQTVAGTGSAISFTAQTTAGTYTVEAENATTGCAATMNGNAVVTIDPLPTVFNVTGGGSYCSGSPAAQAIGLNGSEVGVNYTLLRGATTVETIAGTGAALAFTAQTTAGTYTVQAENATTGCDATMNGNAVVTIDPLPTLFDVTGGGAACFGGSVAIGLTDSEVGVNYTLLRGATTVETIAGTGSALSFTAQTTAGTYTVQAENATTGCDATMNGNAVVTINPLPTVFNVTGGGNYCSGTPVAQAIGLDDSEVGVNYTLLRGATTVQTIAGTGSALSFTAQTTAGTYTVQAENATTGCDATMNGNAVVTIDPLPTVFDVTGGGAACFGGSVAIGLTDSEVGVNYTLLRGATTVETIAGTGSALSFTAQTTAGTYTIQAENATTGCDATMNGNAVVTINPLPTVFNVTGGGSYCSGTPVAQAIGLADSEVGVNYTLLRGATTVQTIAGTGSALSFTAQTTAGTYTVQAENATTGCDATMNGNAVVTIDPLPTVFDVTGGGAACFGGNVAIGLTDSEVGVNYTLLRGATTVETIAGTGSALSFTAQTTAGTYTVQAENAATGCDATMNGNAVVTINPLPTVFNVTGGGSYCSGTPVAQAIGLTDSEVGVNYTLLRGATTVETIAGTGSALSFTAQTTAGTYTVQAENATTGCDATMNGNAVVTIDPLPTLFDVTGGGAACFGGSVAIGLTDSEVGVNYTLLRGATTVETIAGTGSALSFTAQTTAGTYTVQAENATTGCDATMNGNAVVTINPLPTIFDVTGGGNYCSGTPVAQAIGLTDSEVGVNYTLLRGATTVETVAGTGSALSFTAQTTAGTYTVQAENATTGCDATMNGNGVVTIDPLPTVFDVTGGGNYCSGSPVAQAIGLTDSEAGVNYTLLRGATTVQTIAGTGSALSFTAQTTAGTYTVQAENATTGCDATMNGNAVVTIDPLPTVFNVTGGGNYCSGTPVAQAIGLDDSEVGVNYTLLRGATTVETIAGTGSALSFTAQTTAGTYTVQAENATTGCDATMNGNAVVAINPLPTIFDVTGGGNYCSGTPVAQAIGLTDSEVGVNYTLLRGATTVETVAGTGSALSFTAQTTAGTYTVQAENATTGCDATMNGNGVVTIDPLPTVFDVTGGGNYCSGNPVAQAIGLTDSEAGVNYTLLRGATTVQTIAGTGSALSFTAKTTAGTYTVQAENATTGCDATMNGNAVVTIDPLPTVFNVTGGGNYCSGTPVAQAIGLDDSEVGVNYTLLRGATTVETIAGTGSALSFTAQTTAGTYTVQAENATTGCDATMNGNAVVTISALPTASTTGGGTVCSTDTRPDIDFNFTGTAPYNFTYTDGVTPVTVNNHPSNTYTVSNATAGNYEVTALTDATGCTATSLGGAVAVVIVTSPNAGTPDSGTGCTTDAAFDLFAVLDGTPDVGGTWTDLDGSATVITGNNADLTTVTPGNYRFLYTVNGTAPCADATAIVTLTVINGAPDAGVDNTVPGCTNETAFDLFASLGGSPDPGGVWTDLDGSGATITGDNVDLSSVTPGSYRYQYTINLSCGTDDAVVTVNVSGGPDAGLDASASVCNNENSFTLAVGGTPDGGGTWTQTSGPDAISISSGVADFTGATGGTYTFEYRVSQAPCPDDAAVLTVDVSEAPDAGSPSTVPVCNTNNSFDLLSSLGGTPDAGGVWMQLSGGSVITITGNSADFVAAAPGAYTFEYRVSNAPCTDATAILTVNVSDQPDAGTAANVDVCNSEDLFDLFANLNGAPDSGGAWTQLSGTSTINISGDDADFTSAVGGPYTFEYRVSNSPCTDAVAVLTVNVTEAPDAGSPDNVTACNSDTAFDLFAALGGTPDVLGSWTDLDGSGATITGNNLNITTLTAGNSYRYQYTVLGNAPCVNSSAIVTVNVINGAPDAGGDNNATACTNDSSFDLFANLIGSPDPGGVWTDLDGSGASITGDDVDLTTVIPNTYRYQYTISAGTCGTSTSIVTVDVNAAPEAGSDNSVSTCGDATAFDLIGNLGGSPDSGGTWTDLDNSNAIITGNSANFTSVPAGTYRFEYRIAAVGCADDVAVLTVDVQSVPVPTYTSANAACNGVGSGSITITGVTGGVPVYQYSLNGSPLQASNVFSNLSSGIYSLVVVDGNGCSSASVPITISANSFILPTISKTDAECIGKPTGIIAVSAVAGGSGTYEYSFDNGTTYDNNPTKSGLAAGTNYSVLVRDVNTLCISSVSSVIINATTEIEASITKTNASSCNGNDGSITVNVIGGLTPYLYSNDGGNTFPSSTNVFTGLNQGTYEIVVQDNNGCLSDTETVNIDLIGNIVPVIAKTDASCRGISDGTITISSVTGGTAPYTYSIQNGDAGTYVGTNVFTNLEADNYSVIVKDASGCISSVHSVVIDNDLVITMDVNKVDESCTGGDGQITVTNVVGGVGPYDYSTNDVAGPFNASNVIDDLSVGEYEVVVRDANGCMSESKPTDINRPSNCNNNPGNNCLQFIFEITSSRPTCDDQDNGSITIKIRPADPLRSVFSYYVLLYDSVITATRTEIFRQAIVIPANMEMTFSDLKASNNYQFFIDDGTYTCEQLSHSLPLATTVSASTDPASFKDASCYDEANGEALITVTGGHSPYEYSVDNGNNWEEFSSGQVLTTLPPNGTYPVLVRDDASDLCPAGVIVTIDNPATKITSATQTTDATCNNNDGVLEVSNVTGGLAPYEISFQGGFFESFSGTKTYSGLQYGRKYFTIMDANGCQMLDSADIVSPNQVILKKDPITVIEYTAPSCETGGTDGSFRVEVDMDATQTPPPYKWGFGRFGDDESTIVLVDFPTANSEGRIIANQTGVSAGSYFVIATSATGCPTRLDFTIEGGAIDVSFNVEKRCDGNTQYVALTDVTGEEDLPFEVTVHDRNSGSEGEVVQTFEVDYPELGIITIKDVDVHPFLNIPGRYSISLKQVQTLCTNGVESGEGDVFNINDPVGASLEEVEFTYPDISSGSIVIGNFAGGESGGYTIDIVLDSASTLLNYFERFDEVVPQNSNSQFEMTYKDILPAGSYLVTVKDAAGCAYELDPILVPVDLTIYPPNIFTPNNDGVNDVFYIRNLPEGGSSKLIITNRWGKEVYSNDDYQNNWGGDGAADGVYFYRLQISGAEPVTGWVEVMRSKAP
jgi:gliding motility-associated-like protein